VEMGRKRRKCWWRVKLRLLRREVEEIRSHLRIGPLFLKLIRRRMLWERIRVE